MHLPDPIERGEATCEAWEAEAELPDGRFKCGCGAPFRLEDGAPVSADPYAIPVCPACAATHRPDHP